jgi:hypothetical protein
MANYSKIALSGATSGVAITVDSVQRAPVTITAASILTGFITFTANNTFTAGQIVTVTGVISSDNTTGAPNQGFNVIGPVSSPTSTSFKVGSSLSGTYTSGGTATASPSSMTTIHTSSATTSTIDEVWLYATNISTAPIQLTIFYGGTATGSSINAPIIQTLPAQSGLTLVVPGLILTSGSSTISAYITYLSNPATTSTAWSPVTISGYVNRIA